MFDAAECMFLYLESSLRVGGDKEGIEIDLPVQREAATGYPLLPASSLKGALRSRARAQQAPIELLGLLGSAPESEEAEATPSSVVVSDSIPLLFPVRSLTGLFAWVTSVETLSRFGRDMAAYGVKAEPLPRLPALDAETAGVAPETALLCRKQTLVLEELTFPVRAAEEVEALGTWMAENAFPDDPVFDFWRSRAARGGGVAGGGLSLLRDPRHSSGAAHPDRSPHGDGIRWLALDGGVSAAGNTPVCAGGGQSSRLSGQGDQEGGRPDRMGQAASPRLSPTG